MKQTLKIIAVSALATAALIKAVPALSEPVPAELNVSVVRTGDLNLSTGEGQRRLQQRLVTAAHAVCDGASAADLRAQNAERQCRDEVLAAARSRVGEIVADKKGGSIILAANK
ncbi:MAG TPA: UrcA family protein [Sphingomicrobium sp.]|nr:UrcA family protein [Sphingomicrobium sp.]